MATDLERRSQEPADRALPLLMNGDRLTQAEFLRRYHAMPDVSHAELIEGRVYVPSPVSAERHGEPHFNLIGWRTVSPGEWVHSGSSGTNCGSSSQHGELRSA